MSTWLNDLGHCMCTADDRWHWPGTVRGCMSVPRDEPKEPSDDVVTEYATRYKSGDHKIRCGDPEIEEIYPLAQWIVHQQRFGGKVYQRRVIVVDDWEEVPKAGSGGLEVDR